MRVPRMIPKARPQARNAKINFVSVRKWTLKTGSNLKTPLEQELLLDEEDVTKLLDKPDPEMAQAIASITLACAGLKPHYY